MFLGEEEEEEHVSKRDTKLRNTSKVTEIYNTNSINSSKTFSILHDNEPMKGRDKQHASKPSTLPVTGGPALMADTGSSKSTASASGSFSIFSDAPVPKKTLGGGGTATVQAQVPARSASVATPALSFSIFGDTN